MTPPFRDIGTVATHTCDDGFFLAGVVTQICQVGGTWSTSAPTCERKGSYACMIITIIKMRIRYLGLGAHVQRELMVGYTDIKVRAAEMADQLMLNRVESKSAKRVSLE